MSKIKEIIVCKKSGSLVSYASKNISELEVEFGEKAISFSFVMDLFRMIMGKTLTIIDSSVIDPKQNKAMKDLLRDVFDKQLSFTSDMVFNQELIKKEVEKAYKENPDGLGEEINPEEVSIEDVLGVN
jgi:hypothetical protein